MTSVCTIHLKLSYVAYSLSIDFLGKMHYKGTIWSFIPKNERSSHDGEKLS